MPRTVNVSDRNDRRENKKQTDAPAETGFFGIRRLWTPTASDMSQEIPSDEATSPFVSLADPDGAVDVFDPLPAQTLLAEDADPSVEGMPNPHALAEQIVAKAVPEEIVGADGSVNFDLLFESAQLPAVTVNADHAVHVLESIPNDMPLHVKHLLVKTSLSVMTNLVQEGSVSADIVGDAARKMLWIARLQENVTAKINAERENAHAEIALLEAAIAAKNSALMESESRANAALQACRHRADQLHNVTLFFDKPDGGRDNENGDGSARNGVGGDRMAGEEEYLPPHLQEDSVLRLLGLPEANGRIPEQTGFIASEHRNGTLQHA